LTTASEMIYVPEQTIPAHTISATTTPRARAVVAELERDDEAVSESPDRAAALGTAGR
jgi:hypothetical protein